ARIAAPPPRLRSSVSPRSSLVPPPNLVLTLDDGARCTDARHSPDGHRRERGEAADAPERSQRQRGQREPAQGAGGGGHRLRPRFAAGGGGGSHSAQGLLGGMPWAQRPPTSGPAL